MAPNPPAAVPNVRALLPLPNAVDSPPALTANGDCCLFAVENDEKSAEADCLDAAPVASDPLVVPSADCLFSD